jgi:hypothetical protein
VAAGGLSEEKKDQPQMNANERKWAADVVELLADVAAGGACSLNEASSVSYLR